ncbi:septum formation protein Maf [Candidatus Nomurabacteria bacterium]|nr:septum formation protein Maf [Candidatus Nomurabacteria bacterium]
MNIILASESPRRKEIMGRFGFPYEIIPSDFEEIHELHSDAVSLVEDFAYKKALDVFEKHSNAIVIGSDTIVLSPDGKLMGKPKDESDAFEMLKQLQGKKSEVYTGVCLLSPGKKQLGYVAIEVYFKSMTDEQIESYLGDPEADWHDKAGAYAIQGKASEWIERFEGEYDGVLGLSSVLVKQYLKNCGVEI